jgi:hypothetical protein
LIAFGQSMSGERTDAPTQADDLCARGMGPELLKAVHQIGKEARGERQEAKAKAALRPALAPI